MKYFIASFVAAAIAALSCSPLRAQAISLSDSEIWELFHQYKEIGIERQKALWRYKKSRGRTSTHSSFKDELTRYKYDRATRIARDDNIPGVSWSEERFTGIPEHRCTGANDGVIQCVLMYDREYRYSSKPNDISRGTHRLEVRARREGDNLRVVSYRFPHGPGWCPAVWESEEDCQ